MLRITHQNLPFKLVVTAEQISRITREIAVEIEDAPGDTYDDTLAVIMDCLGQPCSIIPSYARRDAAAFVDWAAARIGNEHGEGPEYELCKRIATVIRGSLSAEDQRTLLAEVCCSSALRDVLAEKGVNIADADDEEMLADALRARGWICQPNVRAALADIDEQVMAEHLDDKGWTVGPDDREVLDMMDQEKVADFLDDEGFVVYERSALEKALEDIDMDAIVEYVERNGYTVIRDDCDSDDMTARLRENNPDCHYFHNDAHMAGHLLCDAGARRLALPALTLAEIATELLRRGRYEITAADIENVMDVMDVLPSSECPECCASDCVGPKIDDATASEIADERNEG